MSRNSIAHTSPDLLAEQIARLKEVFPEAFAEGKVDFEKLRVTLGDWVDDRPPTVFVHVGGEG